MQENNKQTLKEKLNNGLNYKLLIISFILYILILIWSIMFKFNVYYLVSGQYQYLSLTVLERLKRSVEFYPYGLYHLNIIFNIVIFIPLGLYLPLVFKKYNFLRDILVTLGISMIFEIIQLFTRLGSIDVIDILTNLSGFIIGSLLFCFLKPHTKDKLINYIQLVVVIIFIPVCIFAFINTFLNLDMYKPFFDYNANPFFWK